MLVCYLGARGPPPRQPISTATTPPPAPQRFARSSSALPLAVKVGYCCADGNGKEKQKQLILLPLQGRGFVPVSLQGVRTLTPPTHFSRVCACVLPPALVHQHHHPPYKSAPLTSLYLPPKFALVFFSPFPPFSSNNATTPVLLTYSSQSDKPIHHLASLHLASPPLRDRQQRLRYCQLDPNPFFL